MGDKVDYALRILSRHPYNQKDDDKTLLLRISRETAEKLMEHFEWDIRVNPDKKESDIYFTVESMI